MWAKKQLVGDDFKSLVRDSRDYALTRGGVLRQSKIKNDNCVAHIPFTLFPSPFPKDVYQTCLDVQPQVNKLMLGVARDHEFMEKVLHNVMKVDDFTSRLMDINRKVLREGLSQPVISCIIRSDYMLDRHITDGQSDQYRARQVEVNTISSSMSTHSGQIKKLHDQMIIKYRLDTQQVHGATMPRNDSPKLVAQGIIRAFDAYQRPDSYVLFVIEDRSINFSDHVMSEIIIHELRPDIRIVRRRFVDLPYLMRLGPNKELLIDGDKEVGLVYFRHGYDPSHYCFDSSWDIRLKIERSRAIKCPSINFHLSGAKKFQQAINSTAELERFLKHDESAELSQMLCKFWQIDNNSPEGEEGFALGLSPNKNLVLKPQREGGGHNIYGEDIASFLEGISDPQERQQYILMEYINSPKEKNWLLLPTEDEDRSSQSDWLDQSLVSELGIYGSILADSSSILSNDHAGYLVRSKRSGVNEGGVAAGYAGISSLILHDTTELTNPDLYMI